jgi:CheY-like chemotaxis protein
MMRQASILLVEDEVLVLMMPVDLLEEIGHRVVAEAGNVKDGCALAKSTRYDLAIIDMNLGGFIASPVAEVVLGRGLPFLFLTGYGAKRVPEGFDGAAVLAKPCSS